jgi:hypothetical protein
MEDFVKTKCGVINTNNNDLRLYKMNREKIIREQQLQQRVDRLEKQVKQLYEIIGKLNGS